MIDWLREDHTNPSVTLSDRTLPITIRRHARARRLTMRLATDGSEVRITMPQWGQTKDALVFANARKEWIEQQLGRVPEALTIAPGALLPYRGIELLVDWHSAAKRTPQLQDDRLVLGGPQDNLVKRVQRWLEKEALRLCAQDLSFYCDRAGKPVPELRLSRAKKRWGSCAGDAQSGRCIRINWRLIMAPDHVRRSVVAHEVAHLTHFDHSPAFHALLGELFEQDIAKADQWLKQEGRKLYAAFA